MIRKLLIVVFLFSSVNIFAQKKAPHYTGSQRPGKMAPDTSTADYKSIGSPLPPLRVVTLDHKVITNKTLKNKANLVVMMFNPTCIHCENETDSLEKYLYLLKNDHLLLVASPQMGPYLEGFENNHRIPDYPQIMVGLDSNYLIDRCFLYKMLPQINIYNKHRKLIKVFTGDTPIDSLKPYFTSEKPIEVGAGD